MRLGFFKILLVGVGFNQWEMGFSEKLDWEMGSIPPPPSFKTLKRQLAC
jgi:hypothetical protein